MYVKVSGLAQNVKPACQHDSSFVMFLHGMSCVGSFPGLFILFVWSVCIEGQPRGAAAGHDSDAGVGEGCGLLSDFP